MLAVDLQRCRRLVASMRGLVMASSMRLQLLKDAQVALAKRDDRLRAALATASPGASPLSPRSKYLRTFRGQRVCVIQRQWRKHRWQRLVVERIKLERKWRAMRGNKRVELSATTIQRVFRGYRVRSHANTKPCCSKLETVVLAQEQSRLDRLHTTRLQYLKRLGSGRTALLQAQRDLETARRDKTATEATITAAAKTAVVGKAAASLFVDTKLLDGTIVRMEANQLLLHQMGEVERLSATTADLGRHVQELEERDPVVHHAAASIQSRFRRYRLERCHALVQKRQRMATIRRRISSERCYERMNVGFQRRQLESWQRSAAILSGLYYIIVAKRLLHRYRQQKAVATIERVYRQRLDRTEAQRRVQWRRTKLRAQLFALRRIRQVMTSCWHAWYGVVVVGRQRRARIPLALATGHDTWITSEAICLQRVFRRAIAQRRTLADHVVPLLHPALCHAVTSAVASSTILHDQFLRFYQDVTQTIHAWRVPTEHVYALATRYALPLEWLSIDAIWTWLVQQQPQGDETTTAVWVLDLRSPFTRRTLRFLAPLSRFFDLYDRVSFQVDQIWIHYEALCCVREYLVLLYAHDIVAYTPATTFSSHNRQRAIESLRQRLQEDEEPSPTTSDATKYGRDLAKGPAHAITAAAPFTTFHSVWTDLCEQCLAMIETHWSVRACASCGHRRLERSTAVQPSHAAVAQPLEPDDSQGHPYPQNAVQWIRPSERCDFLVLHAFFHALAPRGHGHRELYTHATLWTIAIAKALEPVSTLYESFGIRTLNDLLVSCSPSSTRAPPWLDALPAPVATKLQLFVRLMQQELVVSHEAVSLSTV